MSLLNPFSALQTIGIAAAACAACLAFGELHGHSRGVDKERERQALEISKQTTAVRAKELATARQTFRLQEVRDAETIRVNGWLADALERLRERSNRRVPTDAAASCAGASGAELSNQDAGFLAREATRADQLRADLETCRGWIETVTTGPQGSTKGD